jgi:hypothetical protein
MASNSNLKENSFAVAEFASGRARRSSGDRAGVLRVDVKDNSNTPTHYATMTGHVTSLGVMPAEEAREKQIRIDVSGGASEKCADAG